MRVRVRFPDGLSVVVPRLRAHATYAELLTAIGKASGRTDLGDARVSRANGPKDSEKIEIGPHGSCRPYPVDGDMLRVEPSGDVSEVPAAPTRGRGRGRGRGITRNPRDGIANLAGLRRRREPARPRADGDDPRDSTWAPDLADAEPAVTRKRSRRGRGRGMVLGDTNTPSRVPARPKKKRRDIGTDDLLEPSKLKEVLGIDIAQAAAGASGAQAARMRNALSEALVQREREAAGERRHAAALAKQVEFIDLGDGIFDVRYKPRGERTWTEEGPMPELPRDALAEVFRSALEDESREKLRAREMSRISPRIFWNMVKYFPDGVEDGLRLLVPDADWSFLDRRKRELSAKAKRNLADQHVLE